MSKITALAASFAAIPILMFAAPALADVSTTGQVEGGDIYRVRDITTNSDFADSIKVACGDTVQFRVRVHNPGPASLTNVKVSATLNTASGTSHSSMVTITADNASPATTTATAGVTTDKASTMSYVSGSTELLDDATNKLSTIDDGVLSGGVKIGTVGVSVQQKRFVQFEAKVNCPTTPPKEECKPGVPKGDVKCETTPPTTTTTTTPPAELPHTGAGNVVFIVAAAAAVAGIAHRAISFRRQTR